MNLKDLYNLEIEDIQKEANSPIQTPLLSATAGGSLGYLLSEGKTDKEKLKSIAIGALAGGGLGYAVSSSIEDMSNKIIDNINNKMVVKVKPEFFSGKPGFLRRFFSKII